MKSFKYFDLNDNGTVEPDEFAKAIEKIGIMIPTKQVSYRFVFSVKTFILSNHEFECARLLILFHYAGS
jgi:hypothetical protein